MYYTQEQIDRANQADLVSFLQSQGEQLTRAGNEYRWKRHDSLTVRGNKWYRHSQSKGGAPVDFVMEFFGKSFTEAVELLTGEKGAAPPPDRPSPAPLSDFRLPPRSTDNRIARNYLTAARRIDEDVTGFFFSTGDIYEEAAHHNAVFVGRDEDGVPRYAHQRGTAGSFRLDVKGSDKAFNFCYRGEGERLFVFEAPIDLLSFLCLFKKDWQKQSYLALGGVGEKALLRFLAFSTLQMFSENGAAGDTVVRGFGRKWEQPLKDIITPTKERSKTVSEQEKNYSSYDFDRLEVAKKLVIERSIYFESEKADISALTGLSLAELTRLRQESAAAEQAVFDRLKTEAAAWEQQAGNTRFLEKAIEYVQTPPVKHTSNKWEKTDYEWQLRSNAVYQMRYHVYENTRYDRQAQKSVPYSWSLTWSVYTNGPNHGQNVKIAGQERKTFSDKAAMEKYLAGRIKAYDRLFTETMVKQADPAKAEKAEPKKAKKKSSDLEL